MCHCWRAHLLSPDVRATSDDMLVHTQMASRMPVGTVIAGCKRSRRCRLSCVDCTPSLWTLNKLPLLAGAAYLANATTLTSGASITDLPNQKYEAKYLEAGCSGPAGCADSRYVCMYTAYVSGVHDSKILQFDGLLVACSHMLCIAEDGWQLHNSKASCRFYFVAPKQSSRSVSSVLGCIAGLTGLDAAATGD